MSVGRSLGCWLGESAGLGLVNLNNFSRLWGVGALIVPGCLVSSPGVTRVGSGGSGLQWEPSEGGVWSRILAFERRSLWSC